MQRLLQQFQRQKFWRERSLREQRLLSATAITICLTVIFFVLIEPALDGRQYDQRTLPQLRNQYAQMQSLATQVGKVSASLSTETTRVNREDIERSLASAGIKPTSLQLSDQQLSAEWTDISFSALTQWLQSTQRERAWSVVEATVAAKAGIDRVDAKLTLRPTRSAP